MAKGDAPPAAAQEEKDVFPVAVQEKAVVLHTAANNKDALPVAMGYQQAYM